MHDLRRRASWTATTTKLALIGLALLGCRPGDDAGDEAELAGDEDEDDESETGESETGEQVALGDDCQTTELVLAAPLGLQATLRGATVSELGGACGLTGPSVFARVHVSGRVDLELEARGRAFEPRFAVLRPGCLPDPEADDRVLACGHQLPVTLFDVGPDLELLVAIGLEQDNPALAAASEGEPDPLDFELVLAQRAVLAQGERCGPDRGRCESGTVCLAVEQDGVHETRCVRPPADSCAEPGSLALPEPGSVISLSIPPDEPHSDAHEHECTGWRRPERVERLELPPSLPSDAALHVRVDDPRVGLALRDHTCAPEHALACTPANAGTATVLVWGGDGELTALAQAGHAPLLFIELPRSDVDGQGVGTITVDLEIASP